MPRSVSIRNYFELLPRDLPDGTVTYDPSRRAFLATREPAGHREAVTSPEWRRAMQLELDALHQNGTCTLVPPVSC